MATRQVNANTVVVQSPTGQSYTVHGSPAYIAQQTAKIQGITPTTTAASGQSAYYNPATGTVYTTTSTYPLGAGGGELRTTTLQKKQIEIPQETKLTPVQIKQLGEAAALEQRRKKLIESGIGVPKGAFEWKPGLYYLKAEGSEERIKSKLEMGEALSKQQAVATSYSAKLASQNKIISGFNKTVESFGSDVKNFLRKDAALQGEAKALQTEAEYNKLSAEQKIQKELARAELVVNRINKKIAEGTATDADVSEAKSAISNFEAVKEKTALSYQEKSDKTAKDFEARVQLHQKEFEALQKKEQTLKTRASVLESPVELSKSEREYKAALEKYQALKVFPEEFATEGEKREAAALIGRYEENLQLKRMAEHRLEDYAGSFAGGAIVGTGVGAAGGAIFGGVGALPGAVGGFAVGGLSSVAATAAEKVSIGQRFTLPGMEVRGTAGVVGLGVGIATAYGISKPITAGALRLTGGVKVGEIGVKASKLVEGKGGLTVIEGKKTSIFKVKSALGEKWYSLKGVEAGIIEPYPTPSLRTPLEQRLIGRTENFAQKGWFQISTAKLSPEAKEVAIKLIEPKKASYVYEGLTETIGKKPLVEKLVGAAWYKGGGTAAITPLRPITSKIEFFPEITRITFKRPQAIELVIKGNKGYLPGGLAGIEEQKVIGIAKGEKFVGTVKSIAGFKGKIKGVPTQLFVQTKQAYRGSMKGIVLIDFEKTKAAWGTETMVSGWGLGAARVSEKAAGAVAPLKLTQRGFLKLASVPSTTTAAPKLIKATGEKAAMQLIEAKTTQLTKRTVEKVGLGTVAAGQYISGVRTVFSTAGTTGVLGEKLIKKTMVIPKVNKASIPKTIFSGTLISTPTRLISKAPKLVPPSTLNIQKESLKISPITSPRVAEFETTKPPQLRVPEIPSVKQPTTPKIGTPTPPFVFLPPFSTTPPFGGFPFLKLPKAGIKGKKGWGAGVPSRKVKFWLPLKSDPLAMLLKGQRPLPFTTKFQKFWEKEVKLKGALVSLPTYEEYLAFKTKKRKGKAGKKKKKKKTWGGL